MGKAIGITCIYPEVLALNRDEGGGNNLQVLKRIGNFVYISRQAMRYYLWHTLHVGYNWVATETKLTEYKDKENRKNKVVQFDVSKITKELLSFGFMSTTSRTNTSKGKSITRKAPVAMTDGEFLNPYQGDISFNTNHEMIRRMRERNDAEPNPYNREEHRGVLRWSIIINKEHLSMIEDDWLSVVDKKDPIYEEEWKEKKIFDDECKHLSESAVNEIINEIISSVKNGLIYHTGGRSPGLVPLAVFVYDLKVPVPVMHNFVYAKKIGDKYSLDVSLLKEGAENEWIEKIECVLPMKSALLGDLDDLGKIKIR